MSARGFVAFVRLHGIPILILVFAFNLLFYSITNTINDRNDNRRQTEIINELRSEVEKVIDNQDKNTAQIREQANLIVCLLQLHSDGNFTDREECQRRADEAEERLRSGQPPIQSPTDNDKGNPQGSETVADNPSLSTPTPEICTAFNILCVRGL